MAYRGRFAPSPTGRLHLGSLLAAVGSWLRARAQGGAWIIRIEDLDPPREVPGAARDIVDTLARFGLVSDEPIVQQSQRSDLYRAALSRLIDRGDAYACACTRSDLEPFAGIHPATCLRVAIPDQPVAWRLRVPDTDVGFDDGLFGAQLQHLRRDVGDFVLQRSDGWHAYQLAVVVDDAEQEISEVVRGADLLDSTPRQMLLQTRLGLPTPAYRHLPLVVDEHRRKLSKQHGSLPVDGTAPLPALRDVLHRLGLPGLSGANAEAMLRAALSHGDFDDSAVGTHPQPAMSRCSGSFAGA